MPMNFDTSNKTFRHLMGNGLCYHVPPFQRDYSWTEDEWDDLWQDILGLSDQDSDPVHYMGYLVLQSSDNKHFDVIDGQQRMATLSVLILALLKHLQELVDDSLDAENNLKRIEQLRNSYIGYLDPVTLNAKSKLELNRHNNSFYQNYLVPLTPLPQRGLNASEQQLRKVFFWFLAKIQDHYGMSENSGRELTIFLDKLVDKLCFTVITVTDELNAFRVFETLNARGVRLSASDLLKNYLFSLVSAENPHTNELNMLEERWERIIGLLGQETFQEFLRVFWNSQHKLARKSELFKTIKKSILSKAKAFELLRGLDQSAAVYAMLREPTDTLWNKEERKALAQLKMYNVQQPFAMLLACYNRFSEDKRDGFTKIVKDVAIIAFRYNVICGLHPGNQEYLYNDIAVKVSNGIYSHPHQVIEAMKPIYPSDGQFKSAFSEKEIKTTSGRNKKVVRHILFGIEKQISGREFDEESAKYTLEHILPEHPSEHPSDEWANIAENVQGSMIYRLGNMTLLENSPNRDVGNAGYLIKKEAYRISDFYSTRAIAEHYDTWDEVKVGARQQKMADVASAIWKISFN